MNRIVCTEQFSTRILTMKNMWFYKARWMNVPAENQKG